MSDLKQFPIQKSLDFFDRVLSRATLWAPSKDLAETAGTLIISTSDDEARHVWASAKRLEILIITDSGIEERTHSVQTCVNMLATKVKAFKRQGEEKVLVLSNRDIKILRDVAVYLDRIMITEIGLASKKSAPKKGFKR